MFRNEVLTIREDTNSNSEILNIYAEDPKYHREDIFYYKERKKILNVIVCVFTNEILILRKDINSDSEILNTFAEDPKYYREDIFYYKKDF